MRMITGGILLLASAVFCLAGDVRNAGPAAAIGGISCFVGGWVLVVQGERKKRVK